MGHYDEQRETDRKQNMPPSLIYNAIKTPDGTILESAHRHDYKSYKDANGETYVIDGGLEYIRSSVHDDQISLAVYDDAPHIVQRTIITWGSYGINGDQPLKLIKICDMDTSHLENVLLNVASIRPTIKKCMIAELKARVARLYGEEE